MVDARRKGFGNPLPEIVVATKQNWATPPMIVRPWIDPSLQPRNSSMLKKPIRQSRKHCLKDRIQLKKTCMKRVVKMNH